MPEKQGEGDRISQTKSIVNPENFIPIALAFYCFLNTPEDLRLSVVQWSALTRILRELVSNALYHGHASRVEVALELMGPRLRLRVTDDGEGHSPDVWSHGLGMGGVRKRVKALAGRVAWSEAPGRGITCQVDVPDFDAALQRRVGE